MLVLRPNGMNFEDWACRVVQDIEPIGLAPVPPKEVRWKEWARSISTMPSISQKNIPDPHFHRNWRDWAEQFIIGVE